MNQSCTDTVVYTDTENQALKQAALKLMKGKFRSAKPTLISDVQVFTLLPQPPDKAVTQYLIA